MLIRQSILQFFNSIDMCSKNSAYLSDICTHICVFGTMRLDQCGMRVIVVKTKAQRRLRLWENGQ